MDLLPDKRSIPKQKLTDYHVLIFGESGIGKTSLASQFPNSLIALTETGTKAMSVHDVNVAKQARKENKLNWIVFMELVEQFINEPHDFETFIIDTEDNLYNWCLEYITQKLGAHPGEKDDFGASWAELKKEFRKPHNMIKNNGYGLVSVSHAQYKEVEDLKGKKRDKLIPSVGGSSAEYLINDSDIVVLYDMNREDERILRLEPTKDFTAKQRISTLEQTDIPAGNSAEEAFSNFKAHFDKAIEELNEKENVTEEMIEEHYRQREQEKKMQEKSKITSKIVSECKNLGMKKSENSNVIEDIYGVNSVRELTYEQAEDYLQRVESWEDREDYEQHLN